MKRSKQDLHKDCLFWLRFYRRAAADVTYRKWFVINRASGFFQGLEMAGVITKTEALAINNYIERWPAKSNW